MKITEYGYRWRDTKIEFPCGIFPVLVCIKYDGIFSSEKEIMYYVEQARFVEGAWYRYTGRMIHEIVVAWKRIEFPDFL